MANIVLDAVTNELNTAGIEYSVDPSRRHLHLKFKIGETEKTQVVPKTSSDWRAAKNARAMLRNTLRQLGVPLIKTPDIKEPRDEKGTETPVAKPQSYLLLEQSLATSQRVETDLMAAKKRVTEVEAENARLRLEVEQLTASVTQMKTELDLLRTGNQAAGSELTRQLLGSRSLPYLRHSVIRRLLRTV